MTERGYRTRALTLSLLLHLVLVATTWNVTLVGEPDPGSARAEAEPLILLLEPVNPDVDEPEVPREYTAVPERLAAETPPERADFLGLHDSRAADRLDAGQAESDPGADVESEVTKVAVSQEELDGATGLTLSQDLRDQQESSPSAAAPRGQASEPETGAEAGLVGDMPLPEGGEPRGTAAGSEDGEDDQGEPERPEWLGGSTPSILRPGEDGTAGDRGFDFDQVASGSISGNVVVSGDFSLNTFEWNFAPWMHRFEQDLLRNWLAPYAYRLGVIDGKTKVRLVVEMDGRPSVTEVLDSAGHESLHQASLAAIKSFAPYAPLPTDFPEENLVIILTLHYPAWKKQIDSRGRSERGRTRRGRQR